MARYIDADNACMMFNRFFRMCQTKEQKTLVLNMKQAFLEIAPADVVPRERFDRVFGNLKAVLEERSEDKAEVAREIFEEIENEYADFLFDGHRNIIVLTEKDFCELKKKYMEEV